MGTFGITHWLILGVVLVLVFGGGRFSNMMGDVAKGIKSFKKGMAEDDESAREPSRIEAKKAAEPVFDRDGNRIRETEI
ncbi:MAG: twin-arginine translocase TatA/TatE family subunit [Sphingomonas sp.]|jgi:sec-independent protein translocase protein TatA|uniref:twin-arginine translocase TatA/TatE family subunit n=1 Tax=Sphingomonas sp. TaxID=28214 RepID=UPI003569E542